MGNDEEPYAERRAGGRGSSSLRGGHGFAAAFLGDVVAILAADTMAFLRSATKEWGQPEAERHISA